MNDMAYIVSRTLEHKIAIAENNDQNTMIVTLNVLKEIIDLLKENEAVKPKCKERIGGFVAGICPTCGTGLNNVHNVKACGKCGQAVKWDE